MIIMDYIAEKYAMVLALVGLWIMLKISMHISARMKRLTGAVIVLLLLESLIFKLEEWTQTFDHLSPLRPLLTACTYSLYPIILLFVMQITVTKKMPRSRMFLLLVPEIISIPLYFTSQWTHLICYFTQDNTWNGGTFRFWPYVVFGFYVLVFIFHNIAYLKNYSRTNRLTVMYIILSPIVGVLFYLLFTDYSDYTALFTAAILLYYIFLYIHRAAIDPLTSLLNRQSYYRDMQARGISGAASVDMNELKYLNDHMGHEAGDEALKTVASALRESCGHGGAVYRVGGDEFMVLYTGVSKADIEKSIADMRKRMSQTPYTCAFGYALKTPDNTIHDVVSEADARMYSDKAAIKQAMAERGTPLHARGS